VSVDCQELSILGQAFAFSANKPVAGSQPTPEPNEGDHPHGERGDDDTARCPVPLKKS
jgi:hypothetical protein